MDGREGVDASVNEDDVRATVSSFGTAVDVRHEGVGESEETPHAAV